VSGQGQGRCKAVYAHIGLEGELEINLARKGDVVVGEFLGVLNDWG
jgi:hypothetical protein